MPPDRTPERRRVPTPRAQVACERCGRTEDDPASLLAWSSARDDRGRPQRYCATCSRTHLRAMEAKLDPEHW